MIKCFEFQVYKPCQVLDRYVTFPTKIQAFLHKSLLSEKFAIEVIADLLRPMVLSFLVGLDEGLDGGCVLLSDFERVFFAIFDREECLHPELVNPKVVFFELSLQ